MKKYILLFVAAFFTMLVHAQFKGPSISFKNISYNYGDIKEEGGVQTYRFEFTNTGNEALVLTKVEPSCGCTTSDYTKNPVVPGASGYVTAAYNPMGRPGTFNKSITVTTNGEPSTVILRIQGNVIPKPKTIEDEYPYTVGEIRMKQNHIPFTKILNTVVKTDSVAIINTSKELAKITFQDVPPHLSLFTNPEIFKPGEAGYLYVKFDAKVKNDFGFNMDNVMVLVNGQMNPKNRLTISSDIQEDFSGLTEKERKNAPVVTFENVVFNFGTLKQGESASYDFKLTNTGKRELIIRKTKASCGCTAIQPPQTIIKPGESTVIKATFNSTGKSGQQNKTITITTNDPVNPVTELKITGNVEVEQK